MAIIEKGIRVEAAKVGFDATDGKVHLRHLPCGRVGVLTEYRNVVDVTAVVFDKLRTLDEHTAGAAAGIVYAAIVGLQHFHQRAHHAGGGVELASQLSFLLGKFRQTVFVCSAEDIAA